MWRRASFSILQVLRWARFALPPQGMSKIRGATGLFARGAVYGPLTLGDLAISELPGQPGTLGGQPLGASPSPPIVGPPAPFGPPTSSLSRSLFDFAYPDGPSLTERLGKVRLEGENDRRTTVRSDGGLEVRCPDTYRRVNSVSLGVFAIVIIGSLGEILGDGRIGTRDVELAAVALAIGTVTIWSLWRLRSVSLEVSSQGVVVRNPWRTYRARKDEILAVGSGSNVRGATVGILETTGGQRIRAEALISGSGSGAGSMPRTSCSELEGADIVQARTCPLDHRADHRAEVHQVVETP
jgi:hypothetical protein